MNPPETKSTSLRGKTVALFARHRSATPILLKDCMLEERGKRLFLVGTSLPVERMVKEWTDDARRAIAWDAVEEYLLFDEPDDFYARSLSVAQAAPQGMEPMLELPQSDDGIPVEPSGIAVDADTVLDVGSTVLAFSQGRWWRAEVIAVEADDLVTIHFPGWDAKWDTTLPKTELQVDIADSLEIEE